VRSLVLGAARHAPEWAWASVFLAPSVNDDLRKLSLRGCPGSKAERRSNGRTAKGMAAQSAEGKHRHQNSFLIAATNGQTAGSVAGRAVAADRKC
jgi:hypothetical protein